MHPKVVVFDLDGTLVDSGKDIAQATNFALSSHGLPRLELSEVLSYVGDGARLLLARAARLDPEDQRLGGLLATFLDHYAEHAVDHTRPLPGVIETLDALPDFTLAVCTNKPRKTTEIVLKALELDARFSAVIAGGDLPRNKPDPAPLHEIARRLGVKPPELVMVGDGPQDVECGRAVGARTVGVLGGIADSNRLRAAAPDAVVGSLLELPELLQRWAAEAGRSGHATSR
jgi:2-phosphoglycolate phosphatase